MTKNYFRFLMILFLYGMFGVFSANAQITFAEWTFDTENLLPAVGTGTAENIGGTTTSYATGVDGRAWNTAAYPEQGVGSGTAGVQYTISTAGYINISVSWMNRMSNTAANRLRLQFTLNGTDWTDFEASEENAINTSGGEEIGFDNGTYIADTGTVWFERGADLSEIAGANNNPQFAVRFVTEFVDDANYGAATPTSSYSTNGTIRYDNVVFTGMTGTAPLITANPGNLSGFSYLIGEGPSAAQMIALNGVNLTPETGEINITAPASYEISLDGANFVYTVGLAYSGGFFEDESIAVRLKAGLAAGTYNETLNVSGGGTGGLNIPLSGTVSSGLEPELTNVFLPQYIQGTVPSNNSRVPFAWLATINNLTPNSTYHYYNRVILSSEGETATGAGNIILVNSETKTFTRLTSPNLAISGSYGEFTTDANGSYTGWFITEPTANASRFIPGNNLFMRIILNDGNNGSQPVTYLTTSDSVKVINFGTSASDTAGTGLSVLIPFTPKNFAFIYDNPEGTGRPLAGTPVESTGLDYSAIGTYANFYSSGDLMIGTIIPNINPNGIRRFEERSITDGSIESILESPNGVWEEINTSNPSSGLNAIFLQLTLSLPEITEELGKVYSFDNYLVIELTKESKALIEIIDIQGRVVANMKMNGSKASYQLNKPSGIYLLKLTMPEGVFIKKFYYR